MVFSLANDAVAASAASATGGAGSPAQPLAAGFPASEESAASPAITDTSLLKQQLRAKLLARRDAEDASVRAAADARIKARLELLPSYREAQTVFCYVSVGSEVDTRGLIEDMLAGGKTVCVPRCEGDGIMFAHELSALFDLEEGALGIPAPPRESPLVSPADIDCVIVPCVACDTAGYRVGYGSGYYDRYLSLTSEYHATSIVLCRQSLILKQAPREDHDVAIDCVVTDAE